MGIPSRSLKTALTVHQGDGKYWASGVDNENANYDYLMGADIDHRLVDPAAETLRITDIP
jgi:alpha-amylase